MQRLTAICGIVTCSNHQGDGKTDTEATMWSHNPGPPNHDGITKNKLLRGQNVSDLEEKAFYHHILTGHCNKE